jgi:P-type Ca2+ transporter type 2C
MERRWYAKSLADTFDILGTSEHGLKKSEARERLERNGPNKLPDTKVDGSFIIFLRQFQSPLIYILMIAAGIVLLIGEEVDAIIIAFVLVFNAVIGAVQEGKAQDTLLALKRFVETKAVVLRDGEELIIPDSEIVPGDIIILQEGEKIPADARIIETSNLKIDEAALTGESEAVFKITDTLDNSDLPTIERKNMAFKGTHIVAGNGRAVVVETGLDTVIGKIAQEISVIDTEIPLKANIRHLSNLIIIATLITCVTLFILGLSSGNSVREMFAVSVSVAVSVIPSGLPIALTLILATGVWRMSKRNALVKKLQAVEALGQARVIAVDKTGTITKNEMVIQHVFVNGHTYDVTGVGYDPKDGEFRQSGERIDATMHPGLMLAGKIGAFCTNARTMYSEESDEWRVAGDPTEAAMFVLSEKLGIDKDELLKESPRLGEIPFAYELKYHVVAHKTTDLSLSPNESFIAITGAPEVVLNLCSHIWHNEEERPFAPGEMDQLENEFFELSKKGLRVIAFAKSSTAPEELKPEKIDSLTFVGFFGMKDALRPEVQLASKRAQAAGIRVVMITGDHKVTAEALAREALIYHDGDRVLTGLEVDGMSDITLQETLANTSVFARVTPEHKLRIIQAYKARGEIIAMTGDGVNDAPSLVAADLGVGMGKIGTEVAKEASDIILLDDNFNSIVSAIEEGRSIYKTIKKVVLYLVSTSIGEVLVITGAILLGMPLPLLAAQIIWLNFVTDGFFIPALAMEPREKNLLRGNFERANKYLVDKLMAQRMALMAGTMMIFTLFVFGHYYRTDIVLAWTMSLTLLAAFQWFNAWNCRSEKESVFASNPLSNIYLIVGTVLAAGFQFLAIYHPFFQKYLRTTALGLDEWFIILSFATSIIVVEEVRKFFARQENDETIEANAKEQEVAKVIA